MPRMSDFLYETRSILFKLNLIPTVEGGVLEILREYSRAAFIKFCGSFNKLPTVEEAKKYRLQCQIKIHYEYIKVFVLKNMCLFFPPEKIKKAGISLKDASSLKLTLKEVKLLKNLIGKGYTLFFYHLPQKKKEEFSFLSHLKGTLEAMEAVFKGENISEFKSKEITPIIWERFRKDVTRYFNLDEKIPDLL